MTKTNSNPTHKHIAAFAAALVMTALIAVAMLAFGVNALFNPNTVTTAQAAGATAGEATSLSSSDQVTLDQLQARIVEYQQREAQYQEEIKSATDQVNQLSQQNQQYQELLNALQNAGVIQITSNGRVFITANTPGFSARRGDD